MDTLFSLANLMVLPAWVTLVFAPFKWPGVSRWVQFTVPVLLGMAYLVMIAMFWSERQGGFDSLSSVRALFGHDGLLLAGWLHYLAFDLFIGAWIVERAMRVGLHHVWTIPCLPLTFLFGPIGLVLYLAIESIWRLCNRSFEVTA
ncbi:ABA4-like family protein [Saccharospirillum salsuginis]|uniref:DUF4281 domain-containing protein n=1 Tax=Saccharospirillum salsuginis TaxID=418750 RepID=A0A918K5X9_9GAMM|nr:ABA4-like family protein [Saccharospirillum salsuginis]GGX49921.1 hypothetical protein GCM10007392_16650 [Saccharospirillum salsuginis]